MIAGVPTTGIVVRGGKVETLDLVSALAVLPDSLDDVDVLAFLAGGGEPSLLDLRFSPSPNDQLLVDRITIIDLKLLKYLRLKSFKDISGPRPVKSDSE